MQGVCLDCSRKLGPIAGSAVSPDMSKAKNSAGKSAKKKKKKPQPAAGGEAKELSGYEKQRLENIEVLFFLSFFFFFFLFACCLYCFFGCVAEWLGLFGA
jgi:hypothetical protein